MKRLISSLALVASLHSYASVPDIPDTQEIPDSLLGPEHTDSIQPSHGYTGYSAQDSLIATNISADIHSHPFDMQRHTKALYGSQWRKQVKRALIERCERLFENRNNIISLCDCDPRNLICRPPDCRMESYDRWASRNQKMWYVCETNVPDSESWRYSRDRSTFVIRRPFYKGYVDIGKWYTSPHTGKFGSKRGLYAKESGLVYYLFLDTPTPWYDPEHERQYDERINSALHYLLRPDHRINPAHHDWIRQRFNNKLSFSIPIYGCYIFSRGAFFEEFSHQINAAVLQNELRIIYDVESQEFPQGLRYVTKWSEFVVGMASCKLDAYGRGIDLGVQGAFGQYYSLVKPLIEYAVAQLDRCPYWHRGSYPEKIGHKEFFPWSVADPGLHLLTAYGYALNVEAAAAAYGTPVPPGVARFLSWCRSPAVGRMVL